MTTLILKTRVCHVITQSPRCVNSCSTPLHTSDNSPQTNVSSSKSATGCVPNSSETASRHKISVLSFACHCFTAAIVSARVVIICLFTLQVVRCTRCTQMSFQLLYVELNDFCCFLYCSVVVALLFSVISCNIFYSYI